MGIERTSWPDHCACGCATKLSFLNESSMSCSFRPFSSFIHCRITRLQDRRVDIMECAKTRPLDLPEIVASRPFLSCGSLVRCFRVSKLWHSVLFPCLWEETNFAVQGRIEIPTLSLVQKYASLIQRLSIDYHSAPVLFHSAATFSFLTSLDIRQTPLGDLSDDPALVDFIQRHRELKSVTMNQNVNDALLAALKDCPRLESLSLMNQEPVSDPTEWIHHFEQLWSRLHTMSWEDDPYIRPPPQSATTTTVNWPRSYGPNRIENLSLLFHHSESFPGFYSWIVKQCPDLVRIRWLQAGEGPGSPMKQLADIFQDDPSFGKKLKDIRLEDMTFENQYFQVLMRSLVQLRCLDLSLTNFNHESWTILRTTQPAHLRTLTDLNFENCRHLSGEAIHQMLCEMPNLKIFLATIVGDKVIMEDARPWVCLGLEQLNLRLSLTRFSADPSVRSLVLQRYLARVGQLKRLEVLIAFLPRDVYGFILFIKLRHGWDALKNLRRLRIANWTERYGSEDEIRWILENWPLLESPSRTELQEVLDRGAYSQSNK